MGQRVAWEGVGVEREKEERCNVCVCVCVFGPHLPHNSDFRSISHSNFKLYILST